MKSKLIDRPKYVEEALLFRDSGLVKVVTGIRRCGKSSLLQLVRNRIEHDCERGSSFVSLNLEDRSLRITDDSDMYSFIKSKMNESGRTYLFIDEVQRIEGWHDVVNSLRVEFDCDIYVTGSNAYLLSGELATYLSGRYVEVKMLPLSFQEYATFCGANFSEDSSATALKNGDIITFDDLFSRYLLFGGMPAIASLETMQAMQDKYMSSLYESVIVRDVLDRERRASERRISNPGILRSLCEYIADTVGRQASTTKIAAALSAGSQKMNHSTVAAYLKALEDAYVTYPCKRYDLHGRDILKTMPKYYLVDTGLISYLKGYRNSDFGYVFENAVFLQLLFEGWTVHVGKLYEKEVDFVATKDGRIAYIQVADEMMAEQTRTREIAPLRSIKDNHPKIVIVRQGSYPADIDGISILNSKSFFLRRDK